VYYPEIVDGIKPYVRFMSSYEQRIEPPSKFYQYLLIAAEPYETVGFKLQSMEIEKSEDRYWNFWDVDTKIYHFQFFFKNERFVK
jgi:splicing factor 3A subunit 2